MSTAIKGIFNPSQAAVTAGNTELQARVDATGQQLVVDGRSAASRQRVSIVFQSTATATPDTLLSLVKSTAGVAAGGATTIAVASGKTLRITSMTFSLQDGGAAASLATFNLRVNPAGAAVLGSQSEFRVDIATAALIGATGAINVPIPDGFELSGTQQLAVSCAASATTNILSVTLTGYEY